MYFFSVFAIILLPLREIHCQLQFSTMHYDKLQGLKATQSDKLQQQSYSHLPIYSRMKEFSESADDYMDVREVMNLKSDHDEQEKATASSLIKAMVEMDRRNKQKNIIKQFAEMMRSTKRPYSLQDSYAQSEVVKEDEMKTFLATLQKKIKSSDIVMEPLGSEYYLEKPIIRNENPYFETLPDSMLAPYKTIFEPQRESSYSVMESPSFQPGNTILRNENRFNKQVHLRRKPKTMGYILKIKSTTE